MFALLTLWGQNMLWHEAVPALQVSLSPYVMQLVSTSCLVLKLNTSF